VTATFRAVRRHVGLMMLRAPAFPLHGRIAHGGCTQAAALCRHGFVSSVSACSLWG
jgi:hypothetical protein